MASPSTQELRCWLCTWQLTEASAVRDARDGRRPTCCDCARIRYGIASLANRRPVEHAQIAQRIIEQLHGAIPHLSPTMAGSLEILVRRAPQLETARAAAAVLWVSPSTVQSRFVRAGLPSLRTYLAAIRLVYATKYFEDEAATVSAVAYRLHFSSGQAFCRHVRALRGITASALREVSFETMLEEFIATLIRPYQYKLERFRPLPSRSAND